MFSKPSKSNFLQISPLPGTVCLISEVPGGHSLRGDDIGTRKKNEESERKREKEFEEASVTVNTI